MADICGIVGSSGTGKTRSIVTLDPDSTFIIKVLDKRLSFKNSTTMYSKERKNVFLGTTYDSVLACLKEIHKSQPQINQLVIDDVIYLMGDHYLELSEEVGYAKYTRIAKRFQEFLKTIRAMRPDLMVFILLHDDDDVNVNKVVTKKKLRLFGKLIEQQANPLELMTVCLWCEPLFEKDKITYRFITNNCVIGGTRFPAKSPEGMFDDLFIPNDLAFVLDRFRRY